MFLLGLGQCLHSHISATEVVNAIYWYKWTVSSFNFPIKPWQRRSLCYQPWLWFCPVAWSDNKITYHLFKTECGICCPTETLSAHFPTTYPFHQGKSDPSKDFQARQDNLTCSKMTPLLSAPPQLSLSLLSCLTPGAELAQMRDTLKNKLLIWEWVDSDGWPVLKGTVKRQRLGQLIISVDTRRWCSPSYGIFSIKKTVRQKQWSHFFTSTAKVLISLVVKDRPASALRKQRLKWTIL